MCSKSTKSYLWFLCGGLIAIALAYYIHRHNADITQLKKMVHTAHQSQAKHPIQHVQSTQKQLDSSDKAVMTDNPWLTIQKQVKDTVVQIFANTVDFNWLEPYKTPKQGMSSGSGFFINEQGDIISNYHVVAQAVNVQIQIPSFGLERFDVEIVGVSPDRDIALLRLSEDIRKKIQAKLSTIPHLTLGDSDAILRSHEVLALGYPLGQSRLKSTLGIVSGRERLGYFGYIQVTTPLNPGNSGGPALNEQGEVIGINTAVISGAQNIGYIIPINEVRNALHDLRHVKLLRKPMLGCIFTYSSPEMVNYLHNPAEGGWYVAKVFDNTLIKDVGIQDEDMLYEVDGLKIDMYGEFNVSWSEDKVSFFELLNRYNLNETINFLVYRKGKQLEFNFKFEQKYLPAIRTVYPEFEPEMIDYDIIGGITVMNLTLNHLGILLQNSPDLIKYGRIDNQQKSVVIITQVIPNSQAYESRILRSGEILEEVNGQKIETLKDFREAVLKSKKSRFIVLKTADNLCAVLSLDKILKEEEMLSARYYYKPSALIKQLT